jgi:hypothetical protein
MPTLPVMRAKPLSSPRSAPDVATGFVGSAIRRVIFGPQLQQLREEVAGMEAKLHRELEGLRASVARRFEEFEQRMLNELAQAREQSREAATRAMRAALSNVTETTLANVSTAPPAALAAVEETLRDEIAISAAEVARSFRTLLDERLEEHFAASVGREQLAQAIEQVLRRCEGQAPASR